MGKRTSPDNEQGCPVDGSTAPVVVEITLEARNHEKEMT